MTNIDDPHTHEPTREELLTLNAALRARLDMAVSGLVEATSRLDSVAYEITDGETLSDIRATYDLAYAVIRLARGETLDIPPVLFRRMSLQRQATIKSLLKVTL